MGLDAIQTATATATEGESVAAGAAMERLLLTPAQRAALGVETAPLEAANAVPRPALPGRVSIPNARASVVASRVTGVVAGLEVATGETVRAGQPLARIESREFVRLQRALLEARAAFDLAERDATRERQLVEEGIIAGRRAVASEAHLSQARAVLAEHRAALGLLGLDARRIAALERSKSLQGTLEVFAPIAGTVLEQRAHVGEQLEAGGALYRLGELDDLQVEVHVPVGLAASLAPGDPVDVLGAASASGRILSVGREVHPLDQGVLVRVALDAGASGLRPGQFVQVEFARTPRDEPVFFVPDGGLVRVAGRAFLFREIEGGFEPVAVRVVGGSGRRVAVGGSLAEGEEVAVAGTAALKAYWLSEGGPR